MLDTLLVTAIFSDAVLVQE